MIRENIRQIVKDYDYPYQGNLITEEEFVFDSLKNEKFFQILKSTNIEMLHLINEGDSIWDDPDEEFINLVVAGGGDNEQSIVREDTDKSWNRCEIGEIKYNRKVKYDGIITILD